MLPSQTETLPNTTSTTTPTKEQLELKVRVLRMQVSELLNKLNDARRELGKAKHRLARMGARA